MAADRHTEEMKRALRVLILGPIFLVAGAACALVLPILFFIWWIYGDDLGERWEAIKEVFWDSVSEVWNGSPSV